MRTKADAAAPTRIAIKITAIHWLTNPGSMLRNPEEEQEHGQWARTAAVAGRRAAGHESRQASAEPALKEPQALAGRTCTAAVAQKAAVAPAAVARRSQRAQAHEQASLQERAPAVAASAAGSRTAAGSHKAGLGPAVAEQERAGAVVVAAEATEAAAVAVAEPVAVPAPAGTVARPAGVQQRYFAFRLQ